MVYFGIKLLAKYLGPILIKYVLRKVQQKMEKQFHPDQQERSRSNSNPSNNRFKTRSNKKTKVGEYVDYEEIE